MPINISATATYTSGAMAPNARACVIASMFVEPVAPKHHRHPVQEERGGKRSQQKILERRFAAGSFAAPETGQNVGGDRRNFQRDEIKYQSIAACKPAITYDFHRAGNFVDLHLHSGRFPAPRSCQQRSSLKYFLLGSFATAFFLYGVAMMFGATGSTTSMQSRMLLRWVPSRRSCTSPSR